MANVTTMLTNDVTAGKRTRVFSSDPMASVDAPEPTNATGKFVYKYFTPNERKEYTGKTGIATRSSINPDSPRWIDISYTPPQAEAKAATSQEVTSYIAGNSLLELCRRGFLHIEDSISSDRFMRAQVTAAGIDMKAVGILSGSAQSVTDDEGTIPSSLSELSRRIAQSLTGIRSDAPVDLVLSASAAQNDVEVGQTILKYINSSGQAAQRITYQNGETKEQFERKIDIVSDRQETLGINKLVYDNVALASTCNVNHLLHDEINDLRISSFETQKTARTRSASAGISAETYDVSVNAFSTIPRATTSYRSVLLGYLIEKLEISGGEVIEHESVLIVGSNSQSFRDKEVNYGSTYKYRVRAIFMRETAATFSASGRFGLAKFLVASSGESAEVLVNCIEEIPPPAVTDFLLTYDYDVQGVRVSWSLPVNPQRDIKYFQVFKRSSLLSPFRLVHVIDFDDSTERETLRETYPMSIVESTPIVKCVYVDKKTQPEAEMIYAVCAVDAHGLSSGYSMQISGVFHRSKNRLETKLVSRSGAPKTYPNLYIDEDTFVDVARVSESRTLLTIFDPEALRVTMPGGKQLNLTDESTFTVSLINEDCCLGRNITIQSSKTASTSSYTKSTTLSDPNESVAAAYTRRDNADRDSASAFGLGR